MNYEEGFQLRWGLRKSKVDGDTSSDDEGSDEHKMTIDLVLFGNDEADDDPVRSHSHGNVKKPCNHNGIHSQTIKKGDEKKLKAIKKKRVTRKKAEAPAVKAVNRKRKVVHSFTEKAMLKDLETFADSLVRELAVATESMFTHMQDEMRKLVASAPVRRKNVRPSKNAFPINRVRPSTVANLNSFPRDQLLSSSYIDLRSQLQNQRNQSEFCKLMAAKSLPLKSAELQQPQQFGGFALNHHKAWGSYGKSRSCLGSHGAVPLHHGMESGSSRPGHESFLGARFPSTSRACIVRKEGAQQHY